MANFSGFAGDLLLGIGQGLMAAPKQAEDLNYLRQSRQNNLQSENIKNSQNQLALQQQQLEFKDAQDTRTAALSAWQSLQSAGTSTKTEPSPQTPADNPLPEARAATPVTPSLPALKKSGMSVDQIKDYATKHGLPPEMVYGFMASESGGNKDAVSPVGAVGLFQSMPSTAAQPGYGVKPYDPHSVDGSLDYMSAMFKQAGGDPVKTAAFWNAGPKGNPDNPETKGFISNVQKNMQAFKMATAADDAAAQPTASSQLATREAAGVRTTPNSISALQQQQQQQITQLTKAGQIAMENGNPVVGQKFFAQAAKLQSDGLDLQKKGLDVQKEANKETSALAAGVKDQSSYNGFNAQLAENPAMQAAVRGLNLTGDYATDRNKLATLADRSITLKEQKDLEFKQQELAIKTAKEQRDEAKADAPKIRQAAIEAQDSERQKTVTAQGLPFAPSLESTMAGATPAQIAQQKSKIEAMRNTYVTKTLQSATNANREVQTFSTEIMGLLDPKAGAVTTGGLGRVPGIGAILTTMQPDRQQFEKAANNLVTAKQQALAAIGEGRSAGTAAMARIISTTKPSLDVSNDVNKGIVDQIYAVTQYAMGQAQFTGEYLRANPSATPAAAAIEWSRYENSIGPMIYEDASKPNRMRFNDTIVKTKPDGSPNPNYKDWHQFFKDNP